MAPKVQLGWVLAADERDPTVAQSYQAAQQLLLTTLQRQFPQFDWATDLVNHRTFPPRGALDPLPLLELGLQEKTRRTWDYALVVVPNELTPRTRSFIIGIPSSALEVAVLSSARMRQDDDLPDRLAGLALHMLGHLWGLSHDDNGPMAPPEDESILRAGTFPPEQAAAIADHLTDAADARVEEQLGQWTWLSFVLRTIRADPSGLARAVWRYHPWRLPFRMGRLTAAAAVSLVFLLLGAEAWEVGIHFAPLPLAVGSLGAVIAATVFIYWGQSLGEIARHAGWREQLMRTRIVVFTTLLLGITALWIVLFVVALGAALAVPREVPIGWVGQPLGLAALARYAAFLAILGVMAGALGGNLEEVDMLRSYLYFDEET